MANTPAVLYEDNHCLALNKPGGLLTQGVPEGVPTLESFARAYIKEKYGKPGNVYLGIPHRLDRPVSGVIVFARSTKSAQRLAEQFRERTVAKLYWALVEGAVEPEVGEWHDWLLKAPDEARTERVEPDTPGAKRASLSYRVLRRLGEMSLLSLEPTTGRMHQIRVQAAVRGHPVVGDRLYGSTTDFGPPAELPRDRLIALHARSLAFLHPILREPVTLTAPLPDYWPEALREE